MGAEKILEPEKFCFNKIQNPILVLIKVVLLYIAASYSEAVLAIAYTVVSLISFDGHAEVG